MGRRGPSERRVEGSRALPARHSSEDAKVKLLT